MYPMIYSYLIIFGSGGVYFLLTGYYMGSFVFFMLAIFSYISLNRIHHDYRPMGHWKKLLRAGKKTKAEKYFIASVISIPIASLAGILLLLSDSLVVSICGFLILYIPFILMALHVRSEEISRKRPRYRQ